MTDTEEQEILETPKPQKKPRKKRVLSEQDKERLRQNLKVGRQTALANRQKKALINKALKKEKEEEDDKFLAEKILKKKDNNEEVIVFGDDEFPLQKWNHFVLNYNYYKLLLFLILINLNFHLQEFSLKWI